MKSKIDELVLGLAREGKVFRLSPEATVETNERFRKDHEEFEREMAEREARVTDDDIVYFPWHPMPLGSGGDWEDD